MFQRIRRNLRKLFSPQLDFQERLTRMVLSLAFAASVIGTGRVLLGADPNVLKAMIPMCILSALAIWIAVQWRNTKLASWMLVIGTNVILFPFVFLLSGGMDSGTPIWFVLGLIYIFLLFKKKAFWIALCLSASSFLAAYIAAYFYGDRLIPVKRFYSFTDSYVTLLFVSCFIGFLLKIQTKTYEKEKKLAEEKKAEVERIAHSKDTFFTNMSHEIRTPINTIIGLNEMILREDISDEIAENAINIQNASKMLLTIINDILDLSKLESGKMEIVPTQYEVSSLFSDLVNLIWVRAHQKNLEFKVDIDPEIPSMLYGDEVRIKQVISNLLTNAVKYTDSGSVTLRAKQERIAADQILLRISVEDTGMGIRRENLDNLFRSFKRVEESDTRNIEGTGLGLTISKQLMELMGGKITVDSVYHKGSVFTIEIRQRIVNVQPIGVINFAAQKQTNHRSRYKHSFISPDARILVVDDNTMNLMVVTKLLRDTKVQIDTVQSGKECLKKTAENAYHIILMDHMMPDMDGEATLHALRSQTRGFCQKTPVIALTANVMPGADQIYQNMGFNGYLAKPINALLLEANLLKFLPADLIEYMAEEADADLDGENTINQIRSAKKRKIAVTADCICDLPRNLLERFQIRLMYCYVHTKEGRFCDLFEVSSDSLLPYLQIEGNYAHSSTASPAEYEYFFADTLSQAEHVIHITASANLSGAYKNAIQASRSFDNVTVIDSAHISSGHGLMVLYASTLAEEDKSVQEICEALEKYRQRIFSNFLVPTTAILYNNGKISGAVHRLCTSLNLHPVLAMSKNRLKLWSIETGSMHHSNRQYVRKLFMHNKQIDSRILFVTYAGCSVRQIDEILAEVQKYITFEKIILQKASATVSSNCGVGTLGLMFVKKSSDKETPDINWDLS